MSMRRTSSFALFAALLLALPVASPAALAAPAKNALGAIAVAPDGGTVVAGGDSRALYLVDPDSLEVRERVYLGTNPLELRFSADGSLLAVHTTDDLVLLLSTDDWQEAARIEDVRFLAYAAAVDSLVVLGREKRVDGAHVTPLRVISLADGSVALEAGVAGKAAGLATSPDASGFAVLTKGEKDESEPKENPSNDLKGFEREIFRQKNDARTSSVVLLDAGGKEIAREGTWFSAPADMVGAWSGEALRFFGMHNRNLETDAAGVTLAMFETPIAYNYGIALAPDQQRAALGSGLSGALMSLGDGSSVVFELDAQPGIEEFILGFGFAPDGAIYGGTSSYRLFRLSPDGEIEAIRPVY